MMDDNYNALIKLADVGYEKMISQRSEGIGYAITKVNSLDDMLVKMGLSAESAPNQPPANPFTLYFMDLSLTALKMYEHVSESVKNEQSIFIAVSNNTEEIDIARSMGIPAFNQRGLSIVELIYVPRE